MIEAIPSKKPIIVISLVTAICLLGNEMLFIVMPIYWKFFGLTSLWQVGVLLSANRLIRIPINSLVAWFYQKLSKRIGVIIAVLLAVISTFSYGYIKGIWLLLFARCLWGISWSFFRLGGYLTVISCSTPKTRGQYVGLYNGLWGLGTLFGMLFGGLFAELIGIQMVTTLFSVLGAISIFFVIKFIPNTRSTEVELKKDEPSQRETIWNNQQVLAAFATGITVGFVIYGVFASTLSKLIESQMNGSIAFLGLSIGAASLTGLIQAIRPGWEPILAPMLGKYSDQKWGRGPLLIIALISAALCFILLPFKFPFFVFIIVIFIFQLTTTLFITMSDSVAADCSSHQSQVKILAMYTLFVDIGAALGPFIGFIINDHYGIQWLYWLTSSLIMVLAWYWIHASKRSLYSKAIEIE